MTRIPRLTLWSLSILLGCGDTMSANDSAAPDGAVDAGADGGADAGIDTGPPLAVRSVEDLGALPHPSDIVAGRDGASSGVIDGQLLWTFGDTFIYEPTPVDDTNVVTATAAWTTTADPFELTQAVDDSGIPAQFIPYTDEELAQNRSAPLDGWSLWPGAVIDTGDDELLVLFQRIKRTEGSGFDGVGLGTARIAAGGTIARRDPDDLFTRGLPPDAAGELLYGIGGVVVEGELVYFFACESLGGFNQGCRVGRAPRDRADDRSAFTFYDGSAWQADIGAAEVVIENVGSAMSVVYNAHLGRYLSATSVVLSNDIVLRTSANIEGPWPRRGVVVTPSDGGILEAGEGANYLAQEQPALSGDDGREIVISYSRPLGSFRGEVRLARITLE